VRCGDCKREGRDLTGGVNLAALALLAATLACGGTPAENASRRPISLAETEGRTHQAMTAEIRAEGTTPLMYVAGYGDADKVSDFLAKGEDVKARDKDGWTALHHATLGGVHDDVMRLLIRAGAEVNARTPGGETPLMFSARKGKVEEVRTLIEAGADVNLANKSGETALIMVSGLGHSEEEAKAVTELLLRAGADANAKDSSGKTAMRLAKESKRPPIVKLLKDAGATR
jgi:ankyrin repeat protein